MDWYQESLSDFLRDKFYKSLDFWLLMFWVVVYTIFGLISYLMPASIFTK